jgi:hypothetical protein
MTAWRWVWRICKWTLLVLFCTLGIVLLINMHDEPLSPEAMSLLQDSGPEVPRQQNMFFAAVGFLTTGPDPEQAGWDHVQAFQSALRVGKSWMEAEKLSEQPELEFIGDRKMLRPSGDFDAWLESVSSRTTAAAKMLADNRQLLERYEAIQRYQHFANTLPPDIGSDFVSHWDGISRGKRLWIIDLMQRVAQGHLDDAVVSLSHDTLFWRRLLAERRLGSLDKLLISSQVRTNFRICSKIVRAYSPNTEQMEVLREMAAPLSAEERSMAGPFENEFRNERQIILTIYDPAAYAQLFGDGGPLSLNQRLNNFAERRFYLPVATINQLASGVHELIERDRAPCDRVAALKPDYPNPMNLSLGMLRNPTGKVLTGMSLPALNGYAGRMCSLQGFQRMLALQLLIRERKVPDDQIAAFLREVGADYADPFTAAPMQWLPQQRALSFQVANKRDQEMLPWPI